MAALLHQAGENRASIAGLVLAGFGIGAVIYTFCVRWLLGLLGERNMMIGGGLIMAAFCLILTLRLPWPLEFLNFALLGFGFYWLHGCIQVYATELAPAARGSTMALHSASFFFGQAVGPIVYGAGFAVVGATPLLIAGAVIIALVGYVCAQRLHGAKTST
jgi:predicted MFS family arabinose efflux permease